MCEGFRFVSILYMSLFICDTDSRDEAEGPLLPEEEAHSDLASFQPTDSDVPSFLEDCNRVTLSVLMPLKPLLSSHTEEEVSVICLTYNCSEPAREIVLLLTCFLFFVQKIDTTYIYNTTFN